MRTLIWKELREHVRWLPLGLIVIAAVCYLAAPGRNSDPLLASRLVTQLAIVAPLLAFALGIVQAYRDLQPAGAAYLNHRSVTADQIFTAKVVVGFALYATAVSIPLLLLASWIELQGMQWLPMRPAQVLPAMVYALATFALHPAAMLMLAREASWWGTRILPLVPVTMALLPLAFFLRSGGMIGAGLCLIIAVLLAVWVYFAARYGWHGFWTNPPALRINRPLRRRWLLPAYFVSGCVCVVFAAFIVLLVNAESWYRSFTDKPQPSNILAVDSSTGTLWLMTTIQEYNPDVFGMESQVLGGDEVAVGKMVNPLRSENLPDSTQSFAYLYAPSGMHSNSDGFYTNFVSLSADQSGVAYDERGYIVRYTTYPQRRWQSTIAADGVYPPGVLAGRPFIGNPISTMWSGFLLLQEAGYVPPLVDANGLYLLDRSQSNIRQLIDRKVDAVALVESGEGHAPRLVICSDNQLLEYQLLDDLGSDTWFQKADPKNRLLNTRLQSLYDLPLSAKLITTIDLPMQLMTLSHFRIARSLSGWYLAPVNNNRAVFHLTSQGHLETIEFQIEPGTSSPPKNDRLKVEAVIAGVMPGVMVLVIAAIDIRISATQPGAHSLAESATEHPVMAATAGVSFVLITLLSLWLMRRAAQRRGLPRSQVRNWSWSVLLLGLAAPLSVVAIYRRVVREPCPQCQQPRRVDEDRCEHCGAQWEPPQAEGIEIIDAHRLPQQADGIPA